jgi:hypothetical protein
MATFKVAIFRKEGTVLIPCGIPYIHIYGMAGGLENNVVPDGLLKNNGIESIKSEAVEVDRKNKIVVIKDKDGESIG